jgi:hypothetical protein
LEGNILNKNILKINARGLENGLREKEDGIAFFGNNYKDENVEFVKIREITLMILYSI